MEYFKTVTPGDPYSASSYPKSGFYLDRGKSAYLVLKEFDVVYFISDDVEKAKKAIKNVLDGYYHKAEEVQPREAETPIQANTKEISEEFALKMLSIAIKNDKYKDL